MSGYYKRVERDIAEAKASGARELHLSHLAIERLPDSLGRLTDLQLLVINWAKQLTNVSPLSRAIASKFSVLKH